MNEAGISTLILLSTAMAYCLVARVWSTLPSGVHTTGQVLLSTDTERVNMHSQRYSTWIVSPLARSNRVTAETKQPARTTSRCNNKGERSTRFCQLDEHCLRRSSHRHQRGEEAPRRGRTTYLGIFGRLTIFYYKSSQRVIAHERANIVCANQNRGFRLVRLVWRFACWADWS